MTAGEDAGVIIPGEVITADGDIELNPGRTVVTVTVRNGGGQPVRVGSHFHFAEVNPALEFDRQTAWGLRLAVPAGTHVRFEPGVAREIRLVPLAGDRVVPGLRGLAAGPLDAARQERPPVPDPDDIEPACSLDEIDPLNASMR